MRVLLGGENRSECRRLYLAACVVNKFYIINYLIWKHWGCSSVVERLLRMLKVRGSIPLISTKKIYLVI